MLTVLICYDNNVWTEIWNSVETTVKLILEKTYLTTSKHSNSPSDDPGINYYQINLKLWRLEQGGFQAIIQKSSNIFACVRRTLSSISEIKDRGGGGGGG